MSEYYIAKPGTSQSYGPLTKEQIRMGMEQGSVTPDYCYCEEGDDEWKPITELVGGFAPALPPIPVIGSNLNNADKPKEYMALSIISLCLSIFFAGFCCPTFFISLTLSIIAIVKSTSVGTLFIQGRIEESKKASRVAYLCGLWSILVGVISIILYIIGVVILVNLD